MRELHRIPAVGQFVKNPNPILLGMCVLSGLHWPCDSAQRERGIVEMKVARTPDGIGQIFNGDEVCRRILLIQESGNAEYTVAVRASAVAAKDDGELLQRDFLTLEVKAVNTPIYR